jgi:hypothetical protein
MNGTLAAYPQAMARPVALSRAGQMFLAVFAIAVFEGAMRKWVATSLTLPLVGLRDLLALLLIVHAWRGGHLRRHKKIAAAMFAWSLLVFGWGLFQLAGGESSPLIFIIGLRFWLLYTWFAIAAAASLNEADYRAGILLAAIMMLVMAPLAVIQHYSPPGARINTQLDSDEEGVFIAIAGVVRTTGTFSFTAGYSTFMALVAPFVFGVLSARKRRRWQYIFATAVFVALVVGALVSGSRTAVISSGAMFMAYLLGRLLFSKVRQKPAAAAAVLISLILFGIFTFFFQEAITVTQTRFEQAAEAEAFWPRVMTIFFGESYVFRSITWLGSGVGYGSNLAANLQAAGKVESFSLAESEGGRVLLEGGLLGLVYTAIKVAIVAIGLFKSFRIAIRTNSPYPVLLWLTVSLAVLTWPSSGQLTANVLLGITLAFGLLLFQHPTLEIFPARPSPK